MSKKTANEEKNKIRRHKRKCCTHYVSSHLSLFISRSSSRPMCALSLYLSSSSAQWTEIRNADDGNGTRMRYTNTDRSTSMRDRMRLQHNWFSLNILAHSMLHRNMERIPNEIQCCTRIQPNANDCAAAALWNEVHVSNHSLPQRNLPEYTHRHLKRAHSEMFHRVDRGRMCATQTFAAAIMIVCATVRAWYLKWKKVNFFSRRSCYVWT